MVPPFGAVGMPPEHRRRTALYSTRVDAALAAWLLEGDPAVRWQVQRDLLDAPAATWAAERARIAASGWGAALLARQQPTGRWGAPPGSGNPHAGLYTPKWTSTTYTLLLLARMGLPPGNERALAGCRQLVEHGHFFPSGGIALWPPARHADGEACVSAMVLQVLAANGYPDPAPIADLTRFLLDHQFDDGGWNCRLHDGHASFTTTLLALDALAALPAAPDTNAAIGRGREFLLAHRLFRSHTTGAVVADRFTRTPDPIGWQYDILRALDHLATTGAPHDERAADAIAIIAKRRLPDGRWRAGSPPSGARQIAFAEPREPSRWVTLRCLRALRWHEHPAPA